MDQREKPPWFTVESEQLEHQQTLSAAPASGSVNSGLSKTTLPMMHWEGHRLGCEASST